ncbi:MFS transporter [Piscinibacter sakaiensis]|uniref:MFS transporter n=1 Tax=Piscinibacter sakaiensis TaxID=1547922 RepID=UPI0037275864
MSVTTVGPGPGPVLVVGEALVDDYGDHAVVGGAPFNVARSLAALGVPVRMLTRIGDDAAGARVRADFARFGLGTEGLQVDRARPTRILDDQAWDHLDAAAACAAVDGLQPSALYLGTLAQRGPVSRAAITALRAALPAPVVVDLNLRDDQVVPPTVATTLQGAQAVKVNEEELRRLVAWFVHPAQAVTPWGEAGLGAAAEQLLAQFRVGELFVTRGAAGSAWLGPGGELVAGMAGTGRPCSRARTTSPPPSAAWTVRCRTTWASTPTGAGTGASGDPAGRRATVLFAIASGAVLSLWVAGRVVARWGVRRALAGSLLAMAAMLALALHWPSLGWLLPAMLLHGAAMSLYDVAINAEGTALESLSRRAVMGGLHGMFSAGGMLGAALAALLLRAGVDAAWQLAGGLLAGLGLAAWPHMLEQHPAAPGERPPQAFAWPRGRLLLIGALAFAGLTAEGVLYNWSVLYMKQELGQPQAVAGLAFAVFSGAMAGARFAGDALRARVPDARLLAFGALLSALSMAVVLPLAHPVVALVGFAGVGIGLALVAPILYGAATRVPGVSRAAGIAAVTSVGYAGFLVGPPLVGALAQAVSLGAAMGLVVLASLLLALGARRIG